jgi:hypothetical protein
LRYCALRHVLRLPVSVPSLTREPHRRTSSEHTRRARCSSHRPRANGTPHVKGAPLMTNLAPPIGFKDPRQDRRREPEYTGHVEMHIADEPGSVGTRRLSRRWAGCSPELGTAPSSWRRPASRGARSPVRSCPRAPPSWPPPRLTACHNVRHRSLRFRPRRGLTPPTAASQRLPCLR